MDIKKLKELHLQGKNDSEISKIMGIKRQTVYYHRAKLGLLSNFSYKSFRKMDYDTVHALVLNNISDAEIAKRFNVKPISVYFFRKRNNIYRENLNVNKEIVPTERQIALIKGSLLGDASLRKLNVNPIFTCEHGIKQKEYCEWKNNELKTLKSTFTLSKRKTIDARTGIYYESAVLRLAANPAFLTIYNQLYSTGRKTITTEYLKGFNALSLAVMFMDDGYKINHTIGIATNCFTMPELTILTKFLLKEFDLEFHIMANHSIYLATKCFNTFIALILPYLHKSLLYKVS